jgi:hypothetical protein
MKFALSYRVLQLGCAAIVLCSVAGAQVLPPTVSSLNPLTAATGTPNLVITVNGANFTTGSVVVWNNFILTTTPVSASQLTAAVPAQLLTVPGTVTVYVLNPGGRQSNSLSFTVLGSTLTIPPDVALQASVNGPYTYTLQASGGTAPYTWSSTGSLPPGLTMSSSGVITGTPTAAGTYTFTARVTDAAGRTGTTEIAITISLPPISVSTNSLPNGILGQAYNHSLTVAGGTAPYRWTVGSGFPPGLQLQPTTGAITGTPSSAGSFIFQVQVTDTNQLSATRSLTLMVNAPPLGITTVAPLFTGTVGVPYAQKFSVAGGVPPYQWRVASGNTGELTLDTASGTLEGTPRTSGNLSFVIEVADNAGARSSQSFSVAISPPSLTISTGSTLPAGSEGVSYRQTFSVAGGTAPYTWSVVGTGVPGLTLDTTGVLTGNPLASGTFTLNVTVRDVAGVSATRNFTITVSAAPLRITSETQLPNPTLSEPFSHAITAVGGVAPYTWSANGLPEGLAIDPVAGVITGTPTTAGPYSFTVRVSDSTRAASVELFRMVVNLPPAPAATVLGLPQTADPAQQLSFRVSLDSPFPAAITGQAILTFAPDAGAGDSTIQFASGGRTANFTIRADTTDAVSEVPLAVQTGTVAGTITVSVRLQAGGVDITPSMPSSRIRIERSAPVIQTARVVRTSNGLAIEIIGFTTPREVTQMSVTFAAAVGQTLQNSTVSVPVEESFNRWFQDSASSQYGSQFFFTQPFTITGDANAVTARSVTLTNRVGSTTAEIQQ